MPPIKNSVRVRFLIKRKEAICQAFFYEKVGDFNKNWNLQALILLGLEIPRDHLNRMEGKL